MVDRTDPVFFAAVWRFADFCQQLNAGSVYLQSVLKYRRAALRFRAQAGQVTAKGTISILKRQQHLSILYDIYCLMSWSSGPTWRVCLDVVPCEIGFPKHACVARDLPQAG